MPLVAGGCGAGGCGGGLLAVLDNILRRFPRCLLLRGGVGVVLTMWLSVVGWHLLGLCVCGYAYICLCLSLRFSIKN